MVSAVHVTPVPTEEEAAAIVAAVEAMWPRPTIVIAEPAKRPSPWRFSGRWWSRPGPPLPDLISSTIRKSLRTGAYQPHVTGPPLAKRRSRTATPTVTAQPSPAARTPPVDRHWTALPSHASSWASACPCCSCVSPTSVRMRLRGRLRCPRCPDTVFDQWRSPRKVAIGMVAGVAGFVIWLLGERQAIQRPRAIDTSSVLLGLAVLVAWSSSPAGTTVWPAFEPDRHRAGRCRRRGPDQRRRTWQATGTTTRCSSSTRMWAAISPSATHQPARPGPSWATDAVRSLRQRAARRPAHLARGGLPLRSGAHH
jgi:hypothetical protein